MSAVRLDAWLWAIRMYKTRSAATAAVRGGHVRVNGEPVKAAYTLAVGDTVRLRKDHRERILQVTGLISKRVGAPVARQQYVDHSPPPVPRELLAVPYRERGAGRPTKKERREINRLRGRSA
ncbi:RNA-binding S4 domain-containing protein [Micrococcus luteus]